MQIEVPPEVLSRGPRAIEEFWCGAYMMMRSISKEMLETEYVHDAPRLWGWWGEDDAPPPDALHWPMAGYRWPQPHN